MNRKRPIKIEKLKKAMNVASKHRICKSRLQGDCQN